MIKKQKNVRSLDVIADDINKLERTNIIAVGDLLNEARAQCEHGDWLEWLRHWFDMSDTSATRYMKVAELVDKFPKLKNLKVVKTTFYDLVEHDDPEDLPSIVDELTKRSTKARLSARDAERVIKIGIGRRHFGDYPDATLIALMTARAYYKDATYYEKLLAALREHRPDTNEAANAVMKDVIQHAHRNAAKKKEAESEDIDAIINGAPPVLPPPSQPPEPQKLTSGTGWAERQPFLSAVTELLGLRAKPVDRFIGIFEAVQLQEVASFLSAVAAADRKMPPSTEAA